jgi:predicted dehydrogenase
MTKLPAALALAGATCYAAVASSVLLGYRGEPGVESKMLVTARADIVPIQYLKVDAGLSFNLFQNNGLGVAGLGLGVVLFSPAGLTLRFAAQHQQWNDWPAGENRLLAAVEAGPLYGFDAGLGLVRRVPVFGGEHWSPFVWSGGAAEWNFLYRLRWKFFQRENWWLRAGFSSYDRFTAHNPQQFPLEADGAYRLKDGLELVGLATGTGLKSAHVGRRFGFQFAATDEAELLGDERVNTIAVLTRHGLHARQVTAALQAGKHVFCEKPLAIHREELVEVARAMETSDRLVTIGFNRRFAPMARRLKHFLDPVSEPLAMHYRVNAGLLPAGHWHYDPNQGGGRIVSEVCHFIDFLTFLTGALPIRVQTRGLPDGERYHEENISLTVDFADGSIGTVDYLANGDRSFAKERIEVFAGGRVAVLDDFRTLELVANGRHRIWRAHLRQDKGHRAAWEAFVAAIAAGGPPPIPYDPLIAVTLATLAARDSLRSGQPVPVEPLTLG